MTQIASFLSADPLVAGLLILMVPTLAYIGYRVWEWDRAQDRLEADRQRRDRVIQSSHQTPKAPGYPHRRVS